MSDTENTSGADQQTQANTDTTTSGKDTTTDRAGTVNIDDYNVLKRGHDELKKHYDEVTEELKNATASYKQLEETYATTRADYERLTVAHKFNLEDADLELLGNGTIEQLEARAQRITELRQETKPAPHATPVEHLGDPKKDDPAQPPTDYPASWIL